MRLIRLVRLRAWQRRMRIKLLELLRRHAKLRNGRRLKLKPPMRRR